MTSGLFVSSTALGLNLLNAVSPVELLEPTQLGRQTSHQAIAQNVEEETRVRVYRDASPAVVSIETRDTTGSGSIISPDGLILTNAHVVFQQETVTVILADGSRLRGDVIAFGEDGLDLAAVQLRGQRNLPTIPFAPRGSVEVGQSAFAIGNPFGQFQNTFTVGIVSRIDRDRGMIQTDAAINPGNSGGPLLNSQGELIGVNTEIFTSGQQGGNIGIGFAISMDQVQPFLQAVRDGRAPSTAQQPPNSVGARNAEPIRIGQSVQGELSSNSNVLAFDNSFFNVYTFEGQAGQEIEIEMSSRELNPYLILLDPRGRDLIQDDNGGGGTSSLIRISLPISGTYQIFANSRDAGERGRYSLSLEESAPGSNTAIRPPTGQYILQEQGTLGPGSLILPEDGSYYREHTFRGQAGQQVTISMESREFDTFLLLFSPSGELIGGNDDIGPQNLNSAMTITLPETGAYTIFANSYDNTGRGRYTLTVR